jgi:dihydrofolate synthase / folylpolyglutamate synthase
MDYGESSKWFLDLGRLGSKPELETMKILLELMGSPHLQFRSVHVTGTNGKGSTSAMIASILQQAGYKTGLFTSPHLSTLRESIVVNGIKISQEDSNLIIERIKPFCERVEEIRRHPTQFEVLTAMAFEYFNEKKVDFAVVEVGMGGRLDATNVLKPEVAVITNVSLEHTAWLGDTVQKIVHEKAGIIKPGCNVVTATTDDSVYEVIRRKADENGVSVTRVGIDITYEPKFADTFYQRFLVNGKHGVYDLTTSLLGEYQIVNSATAIAAVEALVNRGFAIKFSAFIAGIENVRWPGRMEVMQRNPLVLIDGAKDAEAAKALRQSIVKIPRRRMIVVIAISGDKNIPAMVAELTDSADHVIVTTHRVSRRTADPIIIAAAVAKNGKTVEIIPNAALAIKKVIQLSVASDLILIAGSVFLAGEARELWYPAEN